VLKKELSFFRAKHPEEESSDADADEEGLPILLEPIADLGAVWIPLDDGRIWVGRFFNEHAPMPGSARREISQDFTKRHLDFEQFIDAFNESFSS